jgi:DNA (cytosine-5)-methyltransferase 1
LPKKNTKYTFIDLFAGAGGLSEGFIRAGFLPIAHVEMDKDACETIKTRTAYHYLKGKKKFNYYIDYLKGTITREELHKKLPPKILESVINVKLSDKTIKSVFDNITTSLNAIKRRTVDVIVGGPPCQAYSLAVRKKPKPGRKKTDERKYLYKLYGKFLKKYKPKIFVFENVPGIYTSDNGKYYRNMKKYFKRLGYEMDDKILDAADFGVVQRRKRVIVIGWKKTIKKFKYPKFKKIENKWKVKHIFSDMPLLKPGDDLRTAKYTKRIANKYLAHFEIRNGINFVTQNTVRPLNDKDTEIYRYAVKKTNRNKVLKYNELPEGMRTIKNTVDFTDRFKVVTKGHLSHTMIAHIAKDGHHYIHPDLKQLRSISVREAARIQSFSDDFYFEGTRTSVFRQIGNAVPPLMSKSIAKRIYYDMKRTDNA